ncbi:DUF262 domain-containing protein [Futiania mangrovi]|uniref:DUF262 domain-containing protein n=1 Tax=Futiania mangrovi TaxID=2959716 RepID=A0A9J6PGD0_9PROT|nr:DUF262 domain-containing protein [Futiania mangrovii]MCP1335162.1 DUF262 domain-containing protein [Futiania mangrovii]
MSQEADELEELNDPEFTEDDTSETPPSDIVAYNELRSCADLARMTEDGTIELQPDFQRDVVWNSAEQSRFIDSLVKQLPIPSMCFALDHTKDTWIVIDGLQRMTSIVNFLTGGDWRLSRLDDIDARLSGKLAASFKTGKGEEKRIYDRVQNKTLPITVLRCEFSKRSHMEYLFTVFHRLNSGGAKLNNQEIRNCIFSGPFNNLLRDLDQLESWRRFNQMQPGKNYRFVKQEVILRIFAFAEELSSYSGQIGKFLNDYMHPRRHLRAEEIETKRQLFTQTCDAIDRIYPDGPGDRFPTAVTEALFVGVMKNIDHVAALSGDELAARFAELRASKPFSEEDLSEGLSKRDKVTRRIEKAVDIFAP